MLTSLVLSAVFAHLPPPENLAGKYPKIGAEALRIDLQILKEALTTIHPGIYRYQSPAGFESAFRSLQRDLSQGADQAQVFLAISEFTAKIRCGHTFPSFWNNPIGTQRNLFIAQDKLPVAFRWLEGRMVVTRNDSNSPVLTPGTAITSVNGVASGAILTRLMKLVKGDGGNDAKRMIELELQDRNDWEAFDIYYGLAYQPSSVFRLGIEKMDGSKSEVEVEALTFKQRRANREKHVPKVERDGPEWQWSWPNSKTAVLKMSTWALYNSKWDWKAWLQEGFQDLAKKGAETLVLDVRGNAGGNECGDEIMRYLVKGKVEFPSGKTYVRYRQIPKELSLYLSTWDQSFYDWTASSQPAARVAELNSDAFQIRGESSVNAERGGTILPLEPGFAGRVFVLVDAECSSATFQFAQQVRNYGVGKLVGQPTGGNRKGINGGAIFFTTLPNSQIEIDIPIIAYLAASPQPDTGIEPDVTIQDARADIAAGRDSVMEWVLRQ